jgi:glycosyltransferase involved in cell wall biosynthesis
MSSNITAVQRQTAIAVTPLPGSDAQPHRYLTVVVPTFNEAGNIDELLRQLSAALPTELATEVIFVDDSTDDTPEIIKAATDRYPLAVRLIHRERPTGGLGGAVVEGLRAGRSPWAVVMDGDLQHPASLVPTLLARGLSTDSDVVVATRYANGGSSDGLSNAYRRQVSRSTKALAAVVLGEPVGSMSDPLSGFFAVRIDALRLDAVNPIGYKILLELVVRSGLRRIEEVPFTFGPRHSGESKSTLREGMRYLSHLAALRAAQRATRSAPAGPVTAEHAPAGDAGQLWAARSVTAPELADELSARNGDPRTRLNVLVVTSEAPPIVSGISRCVDRLTVGLREQGHRVDVLSSVQIPRLVLGEYRFSALAGHWPGISRRLKDYDVINLHGPVPTMSDVFLALGAHRGIPIVYTHHSALAIKGLEKLCAVYNRIHWALSGRADLTLTTSKHYADWERRPNGPEVRVVPWGVDVRPRRPKARPGGVPLRVLFVGQMRGYKGVEWLIPAVAGRDEIELTLVGDGPQRREYERLAADLDTANVRFLGRVSDEVLHAEYDRNDVVVLPSVTRAEAYGLVTVEGMAAGCVPVVSDLPGVRDVVEGVGLVVPPRDEAALRDALLRLAADDTRRKELSQLARGKAEEMTWDNCVARYEEALVDAVSAGWSHRTEHGWARTANSTLTRGITFPTVPGMTATRAAETG